MLTATAALLITLAAPADAPVSPNVLTTLDGHVQVAPAGEVLDLSMSFDSSAKHLPIYLAPKHEIEIA